MYTPAVGFSGSPEITLTFPVPNGLSVVLSSSVSDTVTNSFSLSAVSTVPASYTFGFSCVPSAAFFNATTGASLVTVITFHFPAGVASEPVSGL